MPREARKESRTGVYHVFMRGNNKRQIFLDDSDNKKFLNITAQFREKYGFYLLAYCLMGNHFHFIIKTPQKHEVKDKKQGDGYTVSAETDITVPLSQPSFSPATLSQIMKNIALSYAYYYNTKYSQTGHVFQDRFKSEPIENDTYLIEAVRYIHQNPVKAGICKFPGDYKFSSYRDYLSISDKVFTDINDVLEILPLNKFTEFHKDNEYRYDFIDIDNISVKISDSDALIFIEDICRRENISSPAEVSFAAQQKIARELKSKKLSIRQISRLSGISKKVVEIALKQQETE
ncbi:MAG: transposase [Firmicutes bacterium]|nr:transposase [Bacillota bacterium]